ncbi:MAG TPA: hypothetical protein VH281_02710 [Gaiellaceae bacterium]|jgi:hypothetical protein
MEAASSARLDLFILFRMKLKVLIGAVAVAMLVLAVAGWTLEGVRWALPHPRHAV